MAVKLRFPFSWHFIKKFFCPPLRRSTSLGFRLQLKEDVAEMEPSVVVLWGLWEESPFASSGSLSDLAGFEVRKELVITSSCT